MDWFWLKISAAALLLVSLIVGIVLIVVDQEQWLNDQQRKQDECLASGGMWIDNRNTDSYCFFNK